MFFFSLVKNSPNNMPTNYAIYHIFLCFLYPKSKDNWEIRKIRSTTNSVLTNNCNCGFILLSFCLMSLAPGIKGIWCFTISQGIPLNSSYEHANVSLNSSTKSLYSFISFFSNLDLGVTCICLHLLGGTRRALW